MSASNKLTESGEHDMYISQLKEVFDSCDQTGSGLLEREELLVLCERLQLDDQSEYLVNQLLTDKEGVDFGEFQESFVKILCQTYAKAPSSDEENSSESGLEEDEENDDTDGGVDADDDVTMDETQPDEADACPVKREVSPKYVVGEKRYGRKSLPVSAEELEDMSLLDDEDIEVASSTKSLKHSITVGDDTESDEDSSDTRRKQRRLDGHDGLEGDAGMETFEAEGQMNLIMADAGDTTAEADYLRGIWNSLGVGKNGYIDIQELSKVCELIGMGGMNDSQLQQLFDKLDADGDGRVSFREFQNELFNHNSPSTNYPTTPRSKGTTPTRASSSQKKLKFPGSDERTTPSIVPGSGVTGLFSAIDPSRTGFAKTDAIVDLWEQYNVPNGADILLALGFDLNTKVNLSQLSAALEQEMMNPEEQSIIYQAALASYQQEMRHIKSSLEQAVWAKDKLKQDLADANTRNSLLVKEVDERHAMMERSSESKLLSIEQKYQEQVKQLQGELDKEKEHFSTYTARRKQDLEAAMEELKAEEAKLREHLMQAQKEIEKQGYDLEEVTCQLEESEKQGQRLQRELENMEDLNRKLADYESNGGLTPEQQKFAQEKLQRLEQENMSLKDHNDELTAELEHTKQQVTPLRKLGDADVDIHTPIRKDGSIMSDYIKPVIVKKSSFSSADFSDDESRTVNAQGRRLPKAMHDDDDIICKLKTDLSKIGITYGQGKKLFKSAHRKLPTTGVGSSSDRDTIDELKKENQNLKDQCDIERREIEQACRLEINAEEERHNLEKADLLNHIEKEKIKLSDEFERLQQQALSELARELQTNFAHEKEDLIQRNESEKNHLKQKFVEEENKLRERLQEDYREDLKDKLEVQKSKLEQEKFQLEEALAETEPFIKNLEDKNSELEHKLIKQKEKSEQDLERQRKEMEGMLTRHMQTLENVEKEKHEMEHVQKKQNNETEMNFRKETMNLKNEIDQLGQDVRELHRQKAELELELRQQKEEFELSFRQEKQEIVELYNERIKELEDKQMQSDKEMDNLFRKGVESLHGKLRDDFYQLLDEAKQESLKEEKSKLMEKVQQELEDEFNTKKSELSHVFEKEKTELMERYEAQIQAMRQELNILEEKLEEEREVLAQRFDNEKELIEEQIAQQLRDELEDEFCQQMEEIREAYEDEKHEYEAQANLLRQEVDELQRALQEEDKNRKKMDELKKANNKLQQDKRQADRSGIEMRDTLESTKNALEARIDELMAEKEGAITAVKAQFVESSKQSGKEKAAFDAVLVEKETLEKKVGSLTQEIEVLQSDSNQSTELQRENEKLKKDNLELCQHIKNMASKREKPTSTQVPEHAQRAINELTKEKSELEERIVDIQNRYEEIEEMAKKYTHLQFDYGQMSIGQSVVEETLMKTQDKLADTDAKLVQSKRELKVALRYKDKYRLLQKKYEDVCKERDKVSNLAKSLKEQLNKAGTAEKEDHEDKGRLTSVLEEKKLLELQLQKISDKLLEATTNFSISQSQHIRELQQWKEQSGNMVDLQKYTKLQIDLVDNQRSLRDLQEILQTKEQTSSKVFQETSEKHREEMESLEGQKESLMRKLTTLQQILDGQIDKFKLQYEASEKRNALVVGLYKENADLIHTLSRVEEQKKDAVSRCYKLEDQCNNLRRLLKRMAKVAIT